MTHEELWDFPHTMRLRVMGATDSAVREEMIRILRTHLGEFEPEQQLSQQPSRRGNYVSLQARITLHNAEQVRAIYADLNANPHVKVVL